MQELGTQFEKEMRASMEAAIQHAQHEARMLRDEVEWLQRKLEDELQQSAMRLGLCTDLKQRLGEMQDSLQKEVSAREYWQNEATVYEERHSLLEAKLEALMLTHEEQTGMPLEARLDVQHKHLQDKERVVKPPSEVAANDAGPLPDLTDTAVVDRYLEIFEAKDFCGELHRELKTLSVDGIHSLLVAAAGRCQAKNGAGTVVQRIILLWVSRLLERRDGLALQAAVKVGSTEAFGALLSFGGAWVLAPEDGQRPSLLSLCVEHGNASMLGMLLEHLRSFRSALGLANVRSALELASANTANKDIVAALSSHLVVELSHLGNAQYRQGNLEGAIASYQEAIELCERSAASVPPVVATVPCDEHDIITRQDSRHQLCESTRENMVRLRYNLARALHRSDRWSEAREQASAVIVLDTAYVNAYALRAQAAMAAFDWEAAQVDWDHLMAMVEGSEAGILEALSDKADLVATWRKRREECSAQLSLNHYEVLGLPRISNLEAVRRAYKELARQWHPDKHRPDAADIKDRASRRFERIRQAYEVLGEETAKHAYDATLLLCEARPLMTAGSRRDVAAGLQPDAKSTEIADAPSSCQSSPSESQRGSLKARDQFDNEHLAGYLESRNLISDFMRQRSSSRKVARGSKAGASTDSPSGKQSAIDSHSSPSSRWFPSFRPSGCPSSPKVDHAMSGHSIHINLFDAKFVNADSRRNDW